MDDNDLFRLRRNLADQLATHAGEVSKHEIELTRHALWYAMLLEAGADDEIDSAEIDFVKKMYGELITNEPSRNMVLEASENAMQSRSSALSEIRRAAAVGWRSKTLILQGAFLVGIANKVLEPTEAKYLHEIADALAIGRRERKLFFDHVSAFTRDP